jgi:hypothetical protein
MMAIRDQFPAKITGHFEASTAFLSRQLFFLPIAPSRGVTEELELGFLPRLWSYPHGVWSAAEAHRGV